MANVTKIKLNGEIRDIVSDKAVRDDEGNVIKSSYGSSLEENEGDIILKSKDGTTLSSITIPGNGVVSEEANGLAPKITNVDGYLKGDGTWSVPPGASYTTEKDSVGSASLGTATSVNGVTAWSAGTPTSVSIANGVLSITSGTAPSLTYDAESIPNVTVTPVTVVTDLIES